MDTTKNTWSYYWTSKGHAEDYYPTSPKLLETILKVIKPENKRILEIGAGSGRDSMKLAEQGANVTVLDLSMESLQLIQSSCSYGQLLYLQSDAFHCPFPNDTFDLVFHQGLLEHFHNPNELLNENYRILRPHGYCLCDVPQTIHLYTLAKHVLMYFDRWFAGWETQYTMSTLTKLMRRSGFDVIVQYGDWMQPCFLYRVLRELCAKINIELPQYPLVNTKYHTWKTKLLNYLADCYPLHYTQINIGILGQKM